MNGHRLENPAPPEQEAPPTTVLDQSGPAGEQNQNMEETVEAAPAPGEEVGMEVEMEVEDLNGRNGLESDVMNLQEDTHTHPGPDPKDPGGDTHTHPGPDTTDPGGDTHPGLDMDPGGDTHPGPDPTDPGGDTHPGPDPTDPGGDTHPGPDMDPGGDTHPRSDPTDPGGDTHTHPSADTPPSQVVPVVHDGMCVGRRGRYDSVDSSSDSDSSSSSSCGTLAIVLGEDDDDEGFSQGKKPAPIRTIDEVLPEELPAVEEVCISLPEGATLQPVGAVTSIIQQLVVIQSQKETPPIKDDSMIFNSDRLGVGKVFEVFGPVCAPLYILRFNSEQQVRQKQLQLGQTLYYTPGDQYTEYIFTEQLRHMKGSDASWKNDQEPPPEEVDYSDDEIEQLAKRKKKKKNQKKREAPPPDSSPHRHAHPGGDFFRPAVSQRPLQQQRDPRGFPPRHEGAPFYRQQGPPRHPPPPTHYLPPPCPYPPPYQPQAYPLYPPPPWPPYHTLPFSLLPPPPPPPPPPGL